MNITVTPTKVTITNENLIINKGEYHINDCIFTFSQEYNNLIKRAVFTVSSGKSYVVEIENNTCIIPEQVLRFSDKCILGVYAYANEEDELSLRYSPEPTMFKLEKGSYVADADNYLPAKSMEDLIDEFNQYIETEKEQIVIEVVADSKQELDDYNLIKKNELDAYEGTKETELNNYTTVKKNELDSYKTTKEIELDNYETVKESELNTYTGAKKTELDNYTVTKKSELDNYEVIKETELDQHVQEILEENKNLLNAGYKLNGTGESVTLNKTSKNKFVKLDIKGNRKQNIYTGKNLLDISKFQEHYTIDTNGLPAYVSGQNRVTNTTPIDVNNFENVTLSFVNKTTGTIYFIYSLLDKDNNLIKRQASNNNGATINTLNAKYMYICFYDNVTLSSVANVQLELGSTVTTYEPYVGGQPSPNPSYPQEIYAVGDNGSVNTTIVNKNIVNFSNPSNVANATLSFQNDVLTLVGSSARYSYVRYNILDFLKKHAGETISLDYENMAIDGTRYGHVIQINVTDGNGNVSYPPLLKSDLTKQTYTIPNDIASYISAQLHIYCNNDFTTASACTLTITKPILHLGENETSYVPHQHQTYTIPCQKPMVDETDYFDWDNEKEIHGWKKYEITGNESSSIGGTNFATMYNNGNIMRILTLNDMLATSTTNDVFSNCLTTTTDTLWNGVKSGIQSGANTKRVAISVPVSNIETYLGETLTEQNYISAFFQYLHSIGCYIIYKLATPEELAFTTAQNTVVEQIENATSYYEQTNIFSTDNVSPNFDITAVADLNLLINSIDARLTLIEG